MHWKIFMTFAILSCTCIVAQDDSIMEETETPTPTIPPTTLTTTPITTTTTTKKTTTTETPKTTTAPPEADYRYNVTDNATKIVCIMIDGDLSFKVTYKLEQNKTNVTTVKVPKPSSSVSVSGSCNDDDGSQYILIEWGKVNTSSSIKMVFSQSKDEKSWAIKNITSQLYMDKDIFVNATEKGTLDSDIHIELMPSDVPVNHSYKCFSNLSFKNLTTTLNDVAYTYPLEFYVDGIQVQAFNKLSDHNKFVDEIHCDADKIADIVPIAVGCALAALIIIVLIAYIVGRRRRSAVYQSV